MKRACEICGEAYTYKLQDRVTLELEPPVCSRGCFQTLVRRIIIESERLSISIDGPVPQILRNMFEVKVHTLLKSMGLTAYYEAFLFEHYLPDFLVRCEPFVGQVFIEAKGLWQAGAHKKVRKFKAYLQDKGSDIFVIDDAVLRRLSGKS